MLYWQIYSQFVNGITRLERSITTHTNVDDVTLSILDNNNTSNDEIVTYKQMASACSELCCAINSYRVPMKTWLCTIKEWTKHLLSRDQVDVSIISTHTPYIENNETENDTVFNILSIDIAKYYIKANRRNKSAGDFHFTTSGKKISPSVAMVCDDVAYTSRLESITKCKVDRSKKKSKTYELCSRHGH